MSKSVREIIDIAGVTGNSLQVKRNTVLRVINKLDLKPVDKRGRANVYSDKDVEVIVKSLKKKHSDKLSKEKYRANNVDLEEQIKYLKDLNYSLQKKNDDLNQKVQEYASKFAVLSEKQADLLARQQQLNYLDKPQDTNTDVNQDKQSFWQRLFGK